MAPGAPGAGVTRGLESPEASVLAVIPVVTRGGSEATAPPSPATRGCTPGRAAPDFPGLGTEGPGLPWEHSPGPVPGRPLSLPGRPWPWRWDLEPCAAQTLPGSQLRFPRHGGEGLLLQVRSEMRNKRHPDGSSPAPGKGESQGGADGVEIWGQLVRSGPGIVPGGAGQGRHLGILGQRPFNTLHPGQLGFPGLLPPDSKPGQLTVPKSPPSPWPQEHALHLLLQCHSQSCAGPALWSHLLRARQGRG